VHKVQLHKGMKGSLLFLTYAALKLLKLDLMDSDEHFFHA
jgi:hypothetical protein